MSDRRLGPFVLSTPLGRGGSGEVWAARHRGEGLEVAVKIVAGVGGPAAAALRHEVRAVAAFDHPHVILVYDQGETTPDEAEATGFPEGSPWLAMELASATLRDRADHLTWAERLRVLTAVLEGLAHAHAHGILHRDVKPANVLLGVPGSDVVLADFGLAWALSRDADRGDASTSGTPPYMAPEQFLEGGHLLGPWTDLYAVGCVAFQLATGAPPFGHVPRSDAATAHLGQRVPRLGDDVPRGFEDWVRGLLAKAPEDRYARAAEALADLATVGPGSPPPRPRLDPEDLSTERVPARSPGELPRPAGEPRLPVVVPDVFRAPVGPPRGDGRHLVVGLGLVGLREPPLVGRDAELDALWRLLVAVRAGRPAVAVIRGPPGRGSRRVASTFARRAHEVGAVEVIRARTDPATGRLGLADALRRATEHRRDLPPLTSPTVPATLRAIEALAGPRVPLVWLDDPPDDGLVEALAGAGRPVFWLVTRPAGPDRAEPLVRGRGDPSPRWPGDPEVRVFDLPPLPPGAVARLVAGVLPLEPALGAAVEDRAPEPGAAVELVRAWVDRGWLAPSPLGFRLAADPGLAWTTEAAVWRGRVEAVALGTPASDHALLAAATALGARFPRAEWARVAAALGRTLPPSLVDRVERARLLVPAPGDELAFPHPAVREALATRLPPDAAVHRAVAASVPDGDHARRADHLMAAGLADQAFAAYQTAFHRAMETSRYALAHRIARAQQELAAAWPEADGRVFAAALDEADVLRALGRLDDSERAARRSVALGGTHPRHDTALAGLGSVLMQQGRLDEAEGALRRAIAASRAAGRPLGAAWSLRHLAYVSRARGDLRAAAEAADASLAACRAAGDLRGVAFSLVSAASVRFTQGDDDGASALLDEAEAVFPPGEVVLIRGQADALRGWSCLLRRRDDDAARWFAASLSTALAQGVPSWTDGAAGLGWVALRRGRTEEADALFQRAEATLRRGFSPAGLVPVLIGQLAIAGARGAWSEWDLLYADLAETGSRAGRVDPRLATLLDGVVAEGRRLASRDRLRAAWSKV